MMINKIQKVVLLNEVNMVLLYFPRLDFLSLSLLCSAGQSTTHSEVGSRRMP